MNKDTLEKLRELKLYGMYNTFKGSLENYSRNNMTVDKFVNMLVCNEWDERYNRHVNHLIKSAGFRFSASMEEVDYSVERGLDKNLMERLADLTFIKERKNIFITGSSGTGKTFIATALGRCACQKDLRVIYANTARLMGQLKASKASGKILRDLKLTSDIVCQLVLLPGDAVQITALSHIILIDHLVGQEADCNG